MKKISKGLRILQGIRIIVLLLVLSAGLLLVSPIAQAFTFTTIDPPGSSGTLAKGINSSGQIVGSFADFSFPSGIHGFLRDKNGNNFTIIDAPGAEFTEANGINSSVQIVGDFTDSSNITHGFLLNKKGKFTTIDVPGAKLTIAEGISPSGQIVGWFVDSDDVTHGFLRDKKGNFTTIDVPRSNSTEAFGINSSRQIVGFSDIGGILQGFLLSKELPFVLHAQTNFVTIINAPDSIATQALGINSSGQIVGDFTDASNITHGFLLDEKGDFTTINVPNSTSTEAFGINSSGQIVGFFDDSPTGPRHGFLASP